MTSFLICLLLAAGPGESEIPGESRSASTATDKVWVFFRDKGISNHRQYRQAVDALNRAAAPGQRERRLREPIRGFDFDDLPVRETYVRQIEALGGRLRTVSRWLNAASYELPQGTIGRVAELPFVADVKPMVTRTARHPAIDLPVRKTNPTRATDTAYAHRFYGPSYDQARMMGIPDLFFRGFFGAGVKLAILDTGLKLTNTAVKSIRIHKQHDFLSGDHFHSASKSEAWKPIPAESLRYLGLAKDPAVFYSEENDVTLLVFAADSFTYGYGSPRRAVFFSRSTDFGRSWTDPHLIHLSNRAPQYSAHTFENLRLAGHGFTTYLAYNDLASSSAGRPGSNVYLGYFVGNDWVTRSLVCAGRKPDLRVVGDTLYLACRTSDSTIGFHKASVVMSEPNWLSTASVSTDEPLDRLQLAAGQNGAVVIVATGLHSGNLVQFRSTDGGATFSGPEELVPADARSPRLVQNGNHLFLLYKDDSRPPFVRLPLLYSDNMGQNWTARTPATDSTLSIGGFDARFTNHSAVALIYETGGLLLRTNSTDFGQSWTEHLPLDTAGFCYMPCLASDSSDVLAAWVKRGDDNTAWEAGDTARFSTEQPNHGTRMASIIAGYQQGSIVGVAPGVDLMVAKTELYKVAGGRYYEYDLEEDTYIEALEWAERCGVDIISTSLGYRGWYADDQFDGKTAPISIATSLAARRGLIVVTAMGNRDTLNYPWPVPYIVAPADADGVIAAGGVERNLLPWRGTGTGPTADGRCKPELVALSDTVAVVAPDSTDGLEGSVGTSCATALIAGACALVMEAHPDWPADSVKAVLFSTATNPTQSCTFGFGVPRIDSIFKLFPPEPGVPDVPGDEIGAIFPNPFVVSEHESVYFPLNLTRPAPSASISIFTVSGVLIDTFSLNTDAMSRPGRYREIEELTQIGARWDGMTLEGKPVASGLYLVVYRSTFGRHVNRFALVR